MLTDNSKTARSAADAARLRALHEGLRPLVLPNAWDATSAAIVVAVPVPVAADIEGGYGPGPEDVATTVAAVVAAGAAGINLEDSAGPGGPLLAPALQAERISAACGGGGRLVQRSPLPLTVMTGPGGPTVGELAAVGVRRVSVGTAIAEAAYGLVRRAAVELLLEGMREAIRHHLTYVELNALAPGARS